MEEKITNEEWWESAVMRDENAKEFIVHIDNEQQTKLTPEEVVYEEDVDWFNRRVNED